MNVGLVLAAVAEDAQLRAVGPEPPDKIEPDPVRLARADNIAETEAAATDAEHEGVGRDHRLAGEFARPIGRDRAHRRVVLGDDLLAGVAVNAAARRVEDRADTAAPHRFENIVGQQRPFVEIDVRLGHGARDIGIGSKMDDHVMARHGVGQRTQVLDVATHDGKTIVGLMRP